MARIRTSFIDSDKALIILKYKSGFKNRDFDQPNDFHFSNLSKKEYENLFLALDEENVKYHIKDCHNDFDSWNWVRDMKRALRFNNYEAIMRQRVIDDENESHWFEKSLDEKIERLHLINEAKTVTTKPRTYAETAAGV